MKRLTVLMAALLAAMILAVGAMPTRQAPQAEARTQGGFAISVPLCIALTTAFFNAIPLPCAGAAPMNSGVVTLSDQAGTDKDGKPDIADFKGLNAFIGVPQLHEKDGDFVVVVFVDSQLPTQIHVDNGIIKDAKGTLRGHNWICGESGGVNSGDDADCIPNEPNANGAVVFEVLPDPAGTRGPGLITAVQERIPVDIPFKVVGEVFKVTVGNLEKTLQDGADGGVNDPTSQGHVGEPAPRRPLLTPDDTSDDCTLPGGTTGFLNANGTAERTISLAKAFDSDGTTITGAFIIWLSSDPEIGTTAAPVTPTIDLGSLGQAAPQITCGTAKPGTFTLTAESTATQFLAPDKGAILDAKAPNIKATTDLTVVGVPANVDLAVTPAAVDCNGTNKATVSATVTDAAGAKVANGTLVNFDVSVLGTANPIVAKTTDGVATSDVVALSAEPRGVPVVVAAGDTPATTITKATSVTCSGVAGVAVGPPGAGPAGGGPAGAGGGPIGTIQGPNTGSATPSTTDALSWWVLLALGLAAAALPGLRLVVARYRR